MKNALKVREERLSEFVSAGASQTPTVLRKRRPRGRPSKKTPAICNEIIQRLSEGEPLAQICRDDHMPDRNKVYEWIKKDAALSGRCARAREAGFEMIAADCLEIVDGRDGDDAASRRLRAEVRLKLLAKWDPRRYGERSVRTIEIESRPTQMESIVERARRIARELSTMSGSTSMHAAGDGRNAHL